MNKVTIYTTTYCPYCHAAKRLLDAKGIKYEEIDVTTDPDMKRKIMEEMGWRTVPIIIINENLIGGYDQIRELEKEGKLDYILSDDSQQRSSFSR